MLTYHFYIFEKRIYGTFQCFKKKLVKLCHIRYGKGQKVKLEKTTVKVFYYAWA